MRYQVRKGYRHGARREYGPGDVVELTEQEAAGFLDKLELAPEPAPVDAAPTVPEPVEKPTKRSKRKEPAS